jgi:putative hydrolase of the HAD superfamily
MGAPQVAAVLWDADGVLQRVPGGEESMRPAVARLVEDVDGFLLEAYDAERPALRGEVRWLDVLPGLLDRWGIPDAYDELLQAWLRIQPVSAARALVPPLRAAGVACYLATNQDEHRGRFMQEHLGYDDLLDGAFYSFELGTAKPEPGYFRGIVTSLGVAPAQVLLVDDNHVNVESARTAGLRAEEWSYREPVALLRDHLARHGLPGS